MDPDGPGLLSNTGDGLLNVTRRDHHQVVQLIDYHHDEGHVLEIVGITAGRWLEPGCGDALVVPADITGTECREQVIAALHLLDRPTQCIRRFARVGHRLGEQVWEALILTHLDLLRVDQDQAHLVWRGPHEQRGDDAVDPT